MKSRTILLAWFAAGVLATACTAKPAGSADAETAEPKPAAPAPPPKPAAGAPADPDIPIAADFAPEAEKNITADNYEATLDELAKELEESP